MPAFSHISLVSLIYLSKKDASLLQPNFKSTDQFSVSNPSLSCLFCGLSETLSMLIVLNETPNDILNVSIVM